MELGILIQFSKYLPWWKMSEKKKKKKNFQWWKVGGRYVEDIHMNCMTTNCPKWSWIEREINDPSCPSNVSLKKSLKFILLYQAKCKRSLGLFPAPLCSPLFPNTKENSCTITCLMDIKPQIYEHISTTTSSREILLSSKLLGLGLRTRPTLYLIVFEYWVDTQAHIMQITFIFK
jgi:hypothetical protein